MFLNPPKNYQEAIRRKKTRRFEGEDVTFRESIRSHFPFSHVSRARAGSHNTDAALLNSDTWSHIVLSTMTNDNGTLDVEGFYKVRLLSKSIQAEADEQADRLLKQLRDSVGEFRERKINIDAIVLESRSSVDRHLVREERQNSIEFKAYSLVLRSVFHEPNAVRWLEKSAEKLAQWTSRIELFAWSTLKCLSCKSYVGKVYGNGRANVNSPLHSTSNTLFHTALCTPCEREWCVSDECSFWNHPRGHVVDEFRAITELCDLPSKPTYTWMRHWPGIPPSCVFGHGLFIDAFAVSNLTETYFEEREAAEEADRHERARRKVVLAAARERKESKRQKRLDAMKNTYQFEFRREITTEVLHRAPDLYRPDVRLNWNSNESIENFGGVLLCDIDFVFEDFRRAG